eukprot:COSAG02_NODE_9055_length_2346_cov_12.600356_3_plen_102_part_00
MDPDASPGLRYTRCTALCRPQARAEHQLDQAPDARVARARRADSGCRPRARAHGPDSPSAQVHIYSVLYCTPLRVEYQYEYLLLFKIVPLHVTVGIPRLDL